MSIDIKQMEPLNKVKFIKGTILMMILSERLINISNLI